MDVGTGSAAAGTAGSRYGIAAGRWGLHACALLLPTCGEGPWGFRGHICPWPRVDSRLWRGALTGGPLTLAGRHHKRPSAAPQVASPVAPAEAASGQASGMKRGGRHPLAARALQPVPVGRISP